MKKNLIFIFLITLVFQNIPAQSIPKDSMYLGQKTPGNKAEVFAPKIISNGKDFVANCVFTKDGKELYYTVTNNKWDSFEIRYMKYGSAGWSVPAKAEFFGGTDNMEAFISPDGKRLYFNSGSNTNTDIWFTERDGDKWKKAEKIPEPFNSPGYEFFPSISAKNTLFMCRLGEIYFSKMVDGKFSKVENIGTPIATAEYEEADPYISAKEDFIIFHSYGRPDGFGQGDLYISYKKKDGSWTNPKNLGDRINSSEFEHGPSFSPDGKYFFFTRRKEWVTNEPSKVFWIKADFVEEMKHTNFIPYVKNKIADQIFKTGEKILYKLPADTFIDDDGNNTLTYSAKLSNGDKLPSWLNFNKKTLTLIGKTVQPQELIITVTAKDNKGAASDCKFKLIIK